MDLKVLNSLRSTPLTSEAILHVTFTADCLPLRGCIQPILQVLSSERLGVETPIAAPNVQTV